MAYIVMAYIVMALFLILKGVRRRHFKPRADRHCIVTVYVVMACTVIAHIVMACIVMACIVTAYTIMACTVVAHIVMAYIVTACIVMAYIVIASFLVLEGVRQRQLEPLALECQAQLRQALLGQAEDLGLGEEHLHGEEQPVDPQLREQLPKPRKLERAFGTVYVVMAYVVMAYVVMAYTEA